MVRNWLATCKKMLYSSAGIESGSPFWPTASCLRHSNPKIKKVLVKINLLDVGRTRDGDQLVGSRILEFFAQNPEILPALFGDPGDLANAQVREFRRRGEVVLQLPVLVPTTLPDRAEKEYLARLEVAKGKLVDRASHVGQADPVGLVNERGRLVVCLGRLERWDRNLAPVDRLAVVANRPLGDCTAC